MAQGMFAESKCKKAVGSQEAAKAGAGRCLETSLSLLCLVLSMHLCHDSLSIFLCVLVSLSFSDFFSLFFFSFFFFVVLGFEFKAYIHLESLHQPLFVLGSFQIGPCKLFPRLASNHDPPDLCLLSS
jgi:hypothetical protein